MSYPQSTIIGAIAGAALAALLCLTPPETQAQVTTTTITLDQAGDNTVQAITAPASGPVEVVNQLFRPQALEPTQALVDQLRLPEGFRVQVFAANLGNARMLATDEEGTLYLTCPQQNQVKALRDVNGDGVADSVTVALDNLSMVHGIHIHDSVMYLASSTTVWVAEVLGNGALGQPRTIIDDLPPGGQHDNRTLHVGPDNMLYISVGSSCNACEEDEPRYATILRGNRDGSNLNIFARGLRNTIGFDWHPTTEALWGMDHGNDGRGPDIPPEELNLIQAERHYGWPFAYADRIPDPLMDDPQAVDLTKEQFAALTQGPVRMYQAHASPLALAFYTGQAFPERYQNGAFITFRGSWNRLEPVGYKVCFVPFDQNGTPGRFEDFLTGFLVENDQAQFARLAGLIQGADGALYLTDDQSGVIYRVSYTATDS